MSAMKIDGRLIGPGQRTMVVAEIGVNHDGSVARAIELVQHAAAAGADAVKLQIFRADALMHASSVFAHYQQERVHDADPAAMLERYELSHDQIRQVVRAVRELGLTPLATPFSLEDVYLVEQLRLPAIKIASPDLVNRPLLELAVKTRRPLMLSTGAATMDEVSQTVRWLDEWNAAAVLMHCVSSYPTPAYQAHLCWIAELAEFGRPVGYSDHTTDPMAGALAVAAGACVIEKHLTYDRNAAGPDHSTSADPAEFAEYVRLIRSAETMCGSIGKHVLPIEKDVRIVSRQSLVLRRDLRPGEVITADDLTVQRPGTGIPAHELPAATGRVVKVSIRKGTMLQWEMLSPAA